MNTLRRPTIWLGALVGGMLTSVLTAALFLADQVAGLPFIPFDLFDFVSRLLPGPLLTFGIDRMVDMITAFNLGETSAAAKNAELLMALAAFIVLGIVVAALGFGIMNRRETAARSVTPGFVPGLGIWRDYDAAVGAGQSNRHRARVRAGRLGDSGIRRLGHRSQLDL